MQRIDYYILYFTPNGIGRIRFKLQGEAEFRVTNPLSATDFTATAVLLREGNLGYDPIHQVFVSTDESALFESLLKSNPIV
jgi:hypothetical protein